MIRFSIVIPTFNRPASLRKCLASVRAETGCHDSVEIIVSDDGSGAAAAAQNRMICNDFGAKYSTDGKNHGMAVARNAGITASAGEWMVFLDDDVTCDTGWYLALQKAVRALVDDTAAFEGCIHPSGNGIWDREVQNEYGGACLTSHFIVRKSTIAQCGMFDPAFEYTGPYCEDHEFAARVKTCGRIQFLPDCSVTHAPRTVPLLPYIWRAPQRCYRLLCSDRYFYRQHPDAYQTFRRCTTFTNTYRTYRHRHVITVLRRRTFAALAAHPLQSLALIIAACLEQATSWVLLPVFMKK